MNLKIFLKSIQPFVCMVIVALLSACSQSYDGSEMDSPSARSEVAMDMVAAEDMGNPNGSTLYMPK